jgi:hypothetical protein
VGAVETMMNNDASDNGFLQPATVAHTYQHSNPPSIDLALKMLNNLSLVIIK